MTGGALEGVALGDGWEESGGERALGMMMRRRRRGTLEAEEEEKGFVFCQQ